MKYNVRSKATQCRLSLLLLSVALFSCASVERADRKIVPVHVRDYGLYKPASGWPIHVEQTDQIPAVAGTRFGLRYDFRATAAVYRVEWTIPNPSGSEPFVHSYKTTFVPSKGPTRRPMTMVLDKESVAYTGWWHVRLHAGSEVYLHYKFYVFDPSASD